MYAIAIIIALSYTLDNDTTVEPQLFDIVFPYRRTPTYYDPTSAPCGNISKGSLHGLFTPASNAMIGIKATRPSTNANCTINIGNGKDTVESFVTVKPLDVPIINENQSFACGRTNHSIDRITFKLPEEFQCDNCTLQVIKETEFGIYYECSDVRILEKDSMACSDKCQNNGMCINGKCSCMDLYEGEFCEKKKFGGPIINWKFALILLVLILLIIVAVYIIKVLNKKLDETHRKPPASIQSPDDGKKRSNTDVVVQQQKDISTNLHKDPVIQG